MKNIKAQNPPTTKNLDTPPEHPPSKYQSSRVFHSRRTDPKLSYAAVSTSSPIQPKPAPPPDDNIQDFIDLQNTLNQINQQFDLKKLLAKAKALLNGLKNAASEADQLAVLLSSIGSP